MEHNKRIIIATGLVVVFVSVFGHSHSRPPSSVSYLYW